MDNLDTAMNCILILRITKKEVLVTNIRSLIQESSYFKAGSITTRLRPFLIYLIFLNSIYQKISIATYFLLDWYIFEVMRSTVNNSDFILFFRLILMNLGYTDMMIIRR